MNKIHVYVSGLTEPYMFKWESNFRLHKLSHDLDAKS